MSNLKTEGYYSLSRRITLYVACFCSLLLIIGGLTIFIALSHRVDSQDLELIDVKASFIIPHLIEGDVDDIRRLLDSRYPQDLRKRVYVAVYDDRGTSVGRTFNVNVQNLSGIFPENAQSDWPKIAENPALQKIKSLDGRVFSVSTRAVYDHAGHLWTARIAVDHDSEDRISDALGVALLAILFIFIAIIPLSSGIVSRLITKPLRELSRVFENLVPGERTQILSTKDFPDEFSTLIGSFNAMSQKAHTAFVGLQSFSADISHELRNPLNSMRVNLELLLSNQRTLEEYRDSATSCLEDAQRLSRLIDRLLFLLRGERNLLKAEMIRVELCSKLSSLEEIYRPLLEDRGGTFHLICPPGLTVQAEPQLLRHAIINLIENAIKYGVPKSPGVHQAITVAVAPSSKGSNYLEISVIDNGPGVPELDLPYIFDRLYRGDRSRKAAGFGLGLAIVRMVMDLHGGIVEVKTNHNNYTAFILTLPTGN